MSAIEKQIQDLQIRLQKGWNALDIDALRANCAELQEQMSQPGFWDDQEKARIISQEAADLQQQVDDWSKMKEELQNLSSMISMAKEEEDEGALEDISTLFDDVEKRFAKLEFQMLFSSENDINNAIISIHGGAGGTDAMDWAGILLRMFLRYVEKKNWKIEILDESQGEEAGFKHVTFAVRGRFAFGHIKSEAGVHRLVRISPFDAEKMRHTSFALVEVIPELSEMTEKQIDIKADDLRIDTFMSSGKGGQSVNTTYSAVRITHLPTNIVVSCQNERSQQQNKETAMRVLKSRLFQRMLEERAEKIEELKGGHKSPEWGNQIRSYVLHPYKMVKDHRTNEETQDVERILDGDLDAFVEAYLRLEVKNEE